MGWPRRWLYPVLPRRRDVSDRPRGRPQGQGLPTRAGARVTDAHADETHPSSARTRKKRQAGVPIRVR
jgi:hypothetical protein